MKKILSMSLVLALMVATVTGSAFAGQGNGNGNGQDKKEFKDTQGHWGSQAILKLQDLDILHGYADGTFRPDSTLTPEELAVMIDSLVEKRLGSQDDENLTLNEDEEEYLAGIPSWAKNAVRKGLKHDYLEMGRFHSETQCNRLTAVVQLAKALGLEPVTDFTENPFKDRGLMSDEDFGYVLALYNAGVIKGYPDGNFNPNALVNRAQMASIIAHIFDDEDETSSDTTKPVWPVNSSITASAITSNSLTLKWTAASDNEGVAVYKISYSLNSVNKEKFAYTNRTANITGLDADEEYNFTVEARDAAANWSTGGPSVKVSTLESSDTSKPSWTSGAALTVTNASSTALTLNWPDANDNIGVTGYKVYQNGNLLKTLNADQNETQITGLTADTEYTFSVKAGDAAGNWSDSLTKIYKTLI